MKTYIIHWLDGKAEIIKGNDATEAFRNAGIGRGALAAIDYYEEVKETTEDEQWG